MSFQPNRSSIFRFYQFALARFGRRESQQQTSMFVSHLNIRLIRRNAISEPPAANLPPNTTAEREHPVSKRASPEEYSPTE
ncbi:hypothetical protein RRG08_064246 [Elysia crispata]|uniref:Uncharacterized protein n=1 Tax=Elysia crispata TaxID=231223 RepID=A0AAE1CWT1_9GAST|nr:hypothetical protein RRG08_064246 [Elysia crispata]